MMSSELTLDSNEVLGEFSLITTIRWVSALAMMIGGVVPYIPQYQEIRKVDSADGFSTYVCLSLLIANTLRIIFWFGHPFELPLLLQSIIMNIAMLAMIHLCVNIRNKSIIIPSKSKVFTGEDETQHPENQNLQSHLSNPRTYWDFDATYFWEWTDFLSYLEFLATFTAAMGIVMYFSIEKSFIVETVGFLAVFTEALLGVPQFYKNFRKKSTTGMSKKMVLLWSLGDIFKTTYFVVRNAPIQFWVCGILQVAIDFCILMQVFLYRVMPSPVKMLLKEESHMS